MFIPREPGSVGALLGEFHVAEHQHVRNQAGYKQQPGEQGEKSIGFTLAAFTLSLFSLILALLSFYFAESAIDEEGVIKIGRLLFAVSLFLIAHVLGYLSVSFWSCEFRIGGAVWEAYS